MIIDRGSSLNLTWQEFDTQVLHASVTDTFILVSFCYLVMFLFSKDIEESLWCEVLPLTNKNKSYFTRKT